MNPQGYSNLQLRVMSALVLAAVVLLLTWLGGFPFRVLAAAITGAMFYEWLTMTPGGLRSGWTVPAGAIVLVMLGLMFGLAALPMLVLIAVLAILVGILAETGRQGRWVIAGFCYAALAGFALSFLRAESASGLIAILFLFAVVWLTDIGAYFAGKFFGGPKLAPAVSPGKTWSGAIGGAACGVAAGMIVAQIAGKASYGVFVIALLLSAVSQIGDLFESGVKRHAGVKDSSHLIPGHGGVMDRVDGLVAAAIALYVFGMFGGSMNQPASTLF